jgi:hypothetical protein
MVIRTHGSQLPSVTSNIGVPDMSQEQEVCVLLSRTEDSVRGFLALARKEAEAGW